MSNDAAIVWTPGLNTGIDVIDNQHKRIVYYTISHFAFEESLQEECGYQYAKPHKAVHDMFVKRVAKFQEKHYAGEDVALQLHSMLSTWLVHHIKRDDMAYVSDVRPRINSVVDNKQEGSWLSRSLGKFFK